MSGWELVPYYTPLNVKSALRYDGDGKGTLTLEVPAAAPPGKYTLRYGFWTKSGVPYVPPISLTVNLEVIQPADTPYVFDPPTQTITSQLVHGVMYRTDGFSLVQGQGTMALASPGAEEILYTAEQQAAIPAEKRARFIEVTRRDYQPNPSTSLYLLNHSACIRTYETTPSGEPINYCLPPGNYAFRIKFNFTVNGSTTPAEYLGTLAVTP